MTLLLIYYVATHNDSELEDAEPIGKERLSHDGALGCSWGVLSFEEERCLELGMSDTDPLC